MLEELVRVRGIGPTFADKLIKAGIKSIEEIAHSKPEELAWIKGFGIISANKIIKNAKELINLEKGIQKVLNSIKENFAKSCPKCGGEMQQKLIILGPERRLRANQCSVCKFYMPI
jgi:DNA polymerase/3'-5' exonuclease PolX